MKDWHRMAGIFISHNGKEHYIDPTGIDEKALEADPVKALKESIESKGIDITEKQVNRIVQHFSQISILGMDVLFPKAVGSGQPQSPQLLNIEMDNEGSMKMSFYSSLCAIAVNASGQPKIGPTDPITELVSSHKFEAKIDKDGTFKECSLTFQYHNPALSSIPALEGNNFFSSCFEKIKIDEDLAKTNCDNIVKLLKQNSKGAKYGSALKSCLGLYKAIGGRAKAEYILNETLLNPEFNNNNRKKVILERVLELDNSKEIVEKVLKLDNGKNLLAEVLTDSVVKYLDGEFKKNANASLKKDQKTTIAKGLDKIIEPLKQLKPDLDGKSEITELLNGLDSRKLVSLTARESNDVKTGFYGMIKKFCRRIVDALSFSRTSPEIVDNKKILKSFKEYVSDRKAMDKKGYPKDLNKESSSR